MQPIRFGAVFGVKGSQTDRDAAWEKIQRTTTIPVERLETERDMDVYWTQEDAAKVKPKMTMMKSLLNEIQVRIQEFVDDLATPEGDVSPYFVTYLQELDVLQRFNIVNIFPQLGVSTPAAEGLPFHAGDVVGLQNDGDGEGYPKMSYHRS